MTFAQPIGVEIRMRDGVILRADVYRGGGDARQPVLLFRTPYGKGGYRDEAIVHAAVSRGYAVVVQDVRGRYASDGEFDPYRQEGRDGADTIEWAGTRDWSTGRVATAGLSYPGAVQWLAAVEGPSHLVCAFPAMCFSSGRQFFYFGGAFDLSWIPWTVINIAPDQRRRGNLPGPKTTAEARAEWRTIGSEALRHLPLNSLPLLRDVAPFYYEWLDHPDDGDYWDFADIESKHDRVRVPTFSFSGWHDEGYGPIGALRNFSGVRGRGQSAAAREHARVLIGPWTHGDPDVSTTTVGDRDFGASAGLDYVSLVLDWCDGHVRSSGGVPKPAMPVRIFVMGENRWREERTWPVPGTVKRPLYLHGRGGLRWDVPPAGEPPDRYVYDPTDPVIDPYFAAGLGAHDQRAIEGRRDVLVFTSEPLEEPLEVTGHVEFKLWIASTALDTDFYARLIDVAPDGTAWNLMSPTLEVLRVRYREGEREPRPLRPAHPVEIILGNGVTSNLFARGHRIRVQITSSFFPHLDRNLNTGRPVPADARPITARQTVFHDPARPSRVILPIVPR